MTSKPRAFQNVLFVIEHGLNNGTSNNIHDNIHDLTISDHELQPLIDDLLEKGYSPWNARRMAEVEIENRMIDEIWEKEAKERKESIASDHYRQLAWKVLIIPIIRNAVNQVINQHSSTLDEVRDLEVDDKDQLCQHMFNYMLTVNLADIIDKLGVDMCQFILKAFGLKPKKNSTLTKQMTVEFIKRKIIKLEQKFLN